MALQMPEARSSFKELIADFSIPTELLYDIIYCQKSMRQYMRVHQILTSRIGYTIKAKTIEDIERDIIEIGHEQKTLLINLRSLLELHYSAVLRKASVEIDREVGNAHVSRLLSHHIESNNVLMNPTTVKRRYSESQLLSKFGLDDLYRRSDKTELLKISPSISIGINPKQVSLLKPKSERFALQKTHINPYAYARKQAQKAERDGTPTVTRSINSSRLNLLEALNKARSQSLSVTKPQLSPPGPTDNKANLNVPSSRSSTSSDDSLDVPLVSPTYSEEEAEVSQETFLRKFGLYTLEYSHYLKQRRSKRKRRNVHSNEKSDYHYGKLALFEKMNKINKRKKTFLYSPPATRALKKKRTDKDTESTSKSSSIDRSSSSSPDQKVVCIDCLKSDNLCRCETCCAWFHLKCHKPPMSKQSIKQREKMCPGCYTKSKESKHVKETTEPKEAKETEEIKEIKEVIEIEDSKDDEANPSTSDDNLTKK